MCVSFSPNLAELAEPEARRLAQLGLVRSATPPGYAGRRGPPRSRRSSAAAADVQRPETAAQRDGHQLVAALADQADRPRPSAPSTSAIGPSARGQVVRPRSVAASSSADDPDPELAAAWRAPPGSPPTTPTGRCSTAPAAALVTAGVTCTARCRGSTTPVDACALGGAQQRAEVAGVGDPVDGDQERRRAPGCRRARSRASASGSGAALASTPCGASVRASAASFARPTSLHRHPRARAASSAMSSRIGARSASAAIQTSWTRRACPRAAARARPGGPRPARRRPAARCSTARLGRASRFACAAGPGRCAASAGRRRRRTATAGRRACRRRSALTGRRATSATAQAATPSPRPSAPRPSVRLPFTVTGARRRRRVAACISGVPGASFGASSTTVQSTFAAPSPPRAPARTHGGAARCCRRRPSVGSVSGKCSPMSPSPAAPSSASVQAWAIDVGVAVTGQAALAVEGHARRAREDGRPRRSGCTS